MERIREKTLCQWLFFDFAQSAHWPGSEFEVKMG
jgi:hypothetical protein